MEQAKQKIIIQQTLNDALLMWPNKQPLTEIEVKPMQVVSEYFSPTTSTINAIIFGDNLDALSALLHQHAQKIDLIYIDPPFDSNANYYKKVQLKGEGNKTLSIKLQQYEDKWQQNEYLQFLYERLQILHMLLAETGSIYVHCDWRKVHHIRLILDELFGADHFRNEIIWKRGSVKGAKAKGYQFARNHDTILYYTKSNMYTFNRQYIPFDSQYIKRFKKDDGDGLGPYRDDQAIGTRSKQAIEEMKKSGKIFESANGKLRIKTYLKDLKGVVVDDNWSDIAEVNVMSKDRTMYPTQKPEQLLERIIKTSSNEGDIVLDCFSGSGTTAYTAAKLGRNFISIDNNICAVLTTARRVNEQDKPYSIKTVNCNWPVEPIHLQYKRTRNGLELLLLEMIQAGQELSTVQVDDWRELIEQVEIDECYDGKTFRPSIVDIAKGKQLINGQYDLNKTNTTIAVQIIDVFMNIYFVTIPPNNDCAY